MTCVLKKIYGLQLREQQCADRCGEDVPFRLLLCWRDLSLRQAPVCPICILPHDSGLVYTTPHAQVTNRIWWLTECRFFRDWPVLFLYTAAQALPTFSRAEKKTTFTSEPLQVFLSRCESLWTCGITATFFGIAMGLVYLDQVEMWISFSDLGNLKETHDWLETAKPPFVWRG